MREKVWPVLLVLGGIFVGACVAPQLGSKPSTAETPVTPTKWQYEYIKAPQYLDDYNKTLNAEADAGWELVAYSGNVFIFKKPKP